MASFEFWKALGTGNHQGTLKRYTRETLIIKALWRVIEIVVLAIEEAIYMYFHRQFACALKESKILLTSR